VLSGAKSRARARLVRRFRARARPNPAFCAPALRRGRSRADHDARLCSSRRASGFAGLATGVAFTRTMRARRRVSLAGARAVGIEEPRTGREVQLNRVSSQPDNPQAEKSRTFLERMRQVADLALAKATKPPSSSPAKKPSSEPDMSQTPARKSPILSPQATAALGPVSPELAWLQIRD